MYADDLSSNFFFFRPEKEQRFISDMRKLLAFIPTVGLCDKKIYAFSLSTCVQRAIFEEYDTHLAGRPTAGLPDPN